MAAKKSRTAFFFLSKVVSEANWSAGQNAEAPPIYLLLRPE